jgi:hypothetical protein
MDEPSYLELEPLGGRFYKSQLWPLTAEDRESVEKVLGWQLPTEYRDFATEFGICGPAQRVLVGIISDEIGDPELDVFFGSHEDTAYSLQSWADMFLEPHRLLAFAGASNGLFFMRPDGSIVFEITGYNQLYEAAESFPDFLSRVYRRPGSD